MAITPLATVADLEGRGVTVTDDEEPLVENYLATASAAIREAAGVPISQTTSTVTLAGGRGQLLRLPAPPVSGVTSVQVDGEDVDDWSLKRSLGGIWRACGWQLVLGEPTEVTVVYTHGLPLVPDDLVDLTCRIAAATLVAYRSSDGGEGLAAGDVRAERIGDYSVTYGDDGRITEVELPDYLRDRLAARFGGGAAVLGTTR